jgi:hypothetical protein
LVTIDFISPLPLDEGFDSIMTLTDCLGFNIQAIPCKTILTAEELAELTGLVRTAYFWAYL